MWNYLVSGLLTGATSRAVRRRSRPSDLDTLWSIAADEHVSVLGVGAPFIMGCRAAGIEPARDFDLGALAPARLDRVTAARRGVPLGARPRRPRCPALLDQRRHRRVHRVPRIGAGRAGARRRDQHPDARLRRPRLRSGRQRVPVRRHRRTRDLHADAVDADDAAGATPRANGCERPTSSGSPACGTTATGSGSRPTAAASSPDGPTPPSTGAVFASGRRSSTR